ncbi:MAG: hypothetical protein WCY09_01090 [Candidatus Omnitrophota bacterium]
MSIINDALKKTEQSIQKNNAKENLNLNSKPSPKPILLYILILLTGIFLANLIFNLLRYKIKSTTTVEKTAVTNSKPSTPQPKIAAPVLPKTENRIIQADTQANKPDFVLNGIFFSDNSGYALVNNQIIRENDLIDGAKVQKITSNSVDLNLEGKITTLTTNR